MKLAQKIAWAAVSLLSIFGFSYVQDAFGAALPNTPALVDTYLATNITASDTTLTLANGTLRNGQSLSGRYCFVLDVNTPTVEYVCGTAAGTSVTALERGIDLIDPNTTSASLAYSHRRFSTVQVTDYPVIQSIVRRLNGTDGLYSVLNYASNITITDIIGGTNNTIPTKQYVDSIVAGGAPNASLSVAGLVQLATAQQVASSTRAGSTGAFLAIMASTSTSTPNASICGRGCVPATGTDGFISSLFIATSSAYKWSALHTFTAGMIVTASSTFSSNLFASRFASGTTTPVANFQVANASANSTTTVELGKANQTNAGTCLKLYRTDGSAIYAYVLAGTTSFILTTVACAVVTGF